MAVEIEDDVFFADLSKQIAMLIMDDEENFPAQCPLPVQEYPYMPHDPIMMLPPYLNEVAYRRESRGTGVFIPKSTTAPRRKNKSKRSTAMEKNSQNQLQKPASHVANNTSIYPNHGYSNSGVLKRHM
ncbi:hypothetical protein Cni_G15499 [Canna indica]|uniref:Uncharacterized protein n=1 Tax=Canna indica TaxID=4628 RepID=A0AAQ3QFT4_9LILI|nr:hypothetical protein Cni_G15499 [Canna indica]